MNDKLILADGTEITPAHMLPVRPNEIFLYLLEGGMTFAKAYRLLSKSSRTEQITAITFDGQEETWQGYTELTGLRKEDDGQITAILRKKE